MIILETSSFNWANLENYVPVTRERVILLSATRQINDASMREFVDSGGVSLDKYRRVVSRFPLPLEFDDNAQVD